MQLFKKNLYKFCFFPFRNIQMVFVIYAKTKYSNENFIQFKWKIIKFFNKKRKICFIIDYILIVNFILTIINSSKPVVSSWSIIWGIIKDLLEKNNFLISDFLINKKYDYK